MSGLLEASDARIDERGVPLVEGFSVSVPACRRLGLIGDFSGLFRLFSGEAQLVSGRVELSGASVEAARSSGQLGVALATPPLIVEWEAERFLTEAARLGGQGAREANGTARLVLAALGQSHLAARRLATLTVAEKRAIAIASALLDGPSVLAVESPTLGLDETNAALIVDVVERAQDGRSLIVSADALPHGEASRRLLETADDVLVCEAGSLVARGKLAELESPGGRFLVSVTRSGRELAERLVTAGMAVTVARPSGAFTPFAMLEPAELGDARRFVVSLADPTSTRPIVDAALAVGAPIVELSPLPSRADHKHSQRPLTER